MKLPIKFGLITGLASVVWKYIEYTTGMTHSSLGGVAGFIPYFILFIGIAIGIFLHRASNEYRIGIISFKNAARTGVIISMVAGLGVAGYTMFHCLVINPAYLQDYLDFVQIALEKENASAADIAKELAELKRTGTVSKLMFAAFTTTLVIGMIGTFMIAAIFKKEPEQTSE